MKTVVVEKALNGRPLWIHPNWTDCSHFRSKVLGQGEYLWCLDCGALTWDYPNGQFPPQWVVDLSTRLSEEKG